MKKRLIVASIILIYNLIGLISLFGLSYDDPFYGDGSIYLLLFTLPVTFLGFAFRFAESDNTSAVILVQLIILATTLFIGDFITKYIQRRKKQ